MKRIFSLSILTPLIFIAFSFWILAVKNGYMLRWYDEMSLFRPGADAFKESLMYPGGIFRYAGTWLTQLLYHPWLGATVLILIWLLCARLTRYAFGFSGDASIFCYIVPLCLLISILHLDEAALSFMSQGYVFSNTLGFLFTLAVYALFIRFSHRIHVQEAMVVILPFLYPLAGFFALLATVMCIISLLYYRPTGRKLNSSWAGFVSVIFVCMVPELYYTYYPGTPVDNYHLWFKGLPDLTFNEYDLYLLIPFFLAALLLVAYALLVGFVSPDKIRTSDTIKSLAIGAFIISVSASLSVDKKKSEQFRASVLMTQAVENNDWDKVLHIMAATKESPDYTMCVLENLARSYKGLELRPTGHMQPVNKDYRHAEEFTMTAFVDVPVEYNMGRFNQSLRWATEHNVQYGQKVYFIKYTVLDFLMNDELEMARKFNRILKRTMFHSSWAENIEKYIDNPSLIPSLPDYNHLITLRQEEMMREQEMPEGNETARGE